MLYKCSQKIIGFSSYSQFYENSLTLTTRGLAGVTPVRGQVDGVNRSVSSHLKAPSHQTSSHYVLENVAKTGSNGVRTE